MEQAGYAFQAYAQAKFNGIVERLGQLTLQAAPELMMPDALPVVEALRRQLEARGLESLSASSGGGASDEAIAFFRAHDLGFRIRRLRLLARRLSRDWDADPDIDDDALDRAREAIYEILALYFDREGLTQIGEDFGARKRHGGSGAVLDAFAERHLLPSVDLEAEEMLATRRGHAHELAGACC